MTPDLEILVIHFIWLLIVLCLSFRKLHFTYYHKLDCFGIGLMDKEIASETGNTEMSVTAAQHIEVIGLREEAVRVAIASTRMK